MSSFYVLSISLFILQEAYFTALTKWSCKCWFAGVRVSLPLSCCVLVGLTLIYTSVSQKRIRALVYKVLKALIKSRPSVTLHWLCLQQRIWMHHAKIPKADHCSSIFACRSELWHQSQHAVPSCAQHLV